MIIRWKCEDCDFRILYPVERCIHCNGKVKRVIGKEMKVVGFSKVNIPSISHPITPYNIVIIQDEHGHRMPKKTMKEYKIGDSFVQEKSDDMHAVAINKIKYDIDFAVSHALSLIPDIKVDKDTKVLLKNSMMSATYPYLGMSTHPYVLEAVIKHLLDIGAEAKNIRLAETVMFGDFEKALKKTDTKMVLDKYGIEAVDITKTKFIEKKSGDYSFRISEIAFDNDLMVNVPVYRTHMLLGISGALENAIRLVHPDNVKEMATKDPNEAIYRLHEILPKKQIVIGDCYIGLMGNGPLMYGEPGFFNLILASHDPVAVDKVFQEMFLLRKTPHVEKCGDEGIGENELMHIPVVGDELDACRKEIKQPIGSKLIKKMI